VKVEELPPQAMRGISLGMQGLVRSYVTLAITAVVVAVVLSTELVTVVVLVHLLLIIPLLHPLRECHSHSPAISFSSGSSFLAEAMTDND
jgi:hypothetical protein